MINDVKVINLKQIPDERGKIMHMLKCTDPHFEKFGEIYFSVAYPNVIKGWHMHTRQTQFYAVITGMIKLVLFDDRKQSSTYGELSEIFTGEDNYQLIKIPVGVVNGYKAIGVKPAIVANCATEPHEPDEMMRFDPLKCHIKYDWSLKNR
jgi:dTDP-4-dehydrorhamnose 3,5-epimerase and related enzymes